VEAKANPGGSEQTRGDSERGRGHGRSGGVSGRLEGDAGLRGVDDGRRQLDARPWGRRLRDVGRPGSSEVDGGGGRLGGDVGRP
jgi:hypothetical protein